MAERPERLQSLVAANNLEALAAFEELIASCGPRTADRLKLVGPLLEALDFHEAGEALEKVAREREGHAEDD